MIYLAIGKGSISPDRVEALAPVHPARAGDNGHGGHTPKLVMVGALASALALSVAAPAFAQDNANSMSTNSATSGGSDMMMKKKPMMHKKAMKKHHAMMKKPMTPGAM